MQDIEEESVGVKTAAAAQGGISSKRSRAAEVHNLSERVSKSIPNHDAYVVAYFYLQFLALDLEIYVKINWYSVLVVYKQRRRDRINEKMRALQELIPNCNKVNNFSP